MVRLLTPCKSAVFLHELDFFHNPNCPCAHLICLHICALLQRRCVVASPSLLVVRQTRVQSSTAAALVQEAIGGPPAESYSGPCSSQVPSHMLISHRIAPLLAGQRGRCGCWHLPVQASWVCRCSISSRHVSCTELHWRPRCCHLLTPALPRGRTLCLGATMPAAPPLLLELEPSRLFRDQREPSSTRWCRRRPAGVWPPAGCA